jgi:aryl-alcohol dehydrogenase-like predicted oxidoreductase
VNHLDTAASYGDSELRLAPWLHRYRERFFLASKTGERSYEGARDSIRRSLERLQVDQLDLIQLHNLVDPEGHAQALGPGGALEAALEAKAAGLVRFIGVTGHGTRVCAMHLASLERHPFDSVLVPYNYTMMQSPEYAADFETLVTVCGERGVAVQTIKAVARRRWQGEGERRFSWYEPLRDPDAIRRAVHFVLGRTGLFLNTTSDATLLPLIFEAAEEIDDSVSEEQLELDTKSFGIEPLFVRGVSDQV